MANHNYFSHTDRLGRAIFARLAAFRYAPGSWLGEVLAGGADNQASTFQQLRKSPTHWKLILAPQYRRIGIAMAYSATSKFGYYWAMDFGS